MQVMRVMQTMCSALGVLAACSAAAGYTKPTPALQTPSCVTSPLSVSALGVENFVADRRAENRFALPWRNSAPPTVVTDASVCRRATRAYLGDTGSDRADSTLRAVVVQAGGLYFVKALPVKSTAEFEIIAVVNDRFHVVKLVTQ